MVPPPIYYTIEVSAPDRGRIFYAECTGVSVAYALDAANRELATVAQELRERHVPVSFVVKVR